MGGEQILPDKPPSIIVRLVSPELVRNIMNARRSFTYFSTSNVDRSLLPAELAGSLPDCKILVNEVLSPSDFADYLSLKDTAKKLGFKFVWYSNGRILVRWREREKVHPVGTASDLSVIMASLGVAGLASNGTYSMPALPPLPVHGGMDGSTR